MLPTAACPNPDVLSSFLLGQLKSADIDQLAQHVEGCEQCITRLHTLMANDTLVEAMRASADTIHDSPALSGLIARLTAMRSPVEQTAVLPDTRDITAGSGTPPPSFSGELPALSFLGPSQGPDEIGRLGPYRVLKVLGTGGMGVVFLAEDVLLQRRVALKSMKPSVVSGQARERFFREARAAAAIEHEHIVSIYQVGEDRGVPYLAMQLLQGEALDERLKRDPVLPTAEVLRIGREIAEGLAAAHERGLIHRDIKPANIWLEGGRGKVKILDFGLARVVGDTSNLTHSGTIVGTPAYMAPEQARGGHVDARCDLFSLGAVL